MRGEAAGDLDGRAGVVLDFVNGSVVEREDLRAWEAEQDGRVGGDNELRGAVGAEHVMHEDEHGELALRGEGGFGFVEEEEAVLAHAGFEQGQEAFAVGKLVEAATAHREGFGAFGLASGVELVHGVGQVEEAFRAQEEARPRSHGEAEAERAGERGDVVLFGLFAKG